MRIHRIDPAMSLKSADLPAARYPLPGTGASGEAKKITEAAAQFEAIFLQQLLKEMMPREGTFFGKGLGSEAFKGLFLDAMAGEMSRTGALGVRPIMEKELSKNSESEE